MGWNPPEEIKVLESLWWPYRFQIHDNRLEGVPTEAIEAYEKCRKWAWEQGQ